MTTTNNFTVPISQIPANTPVTTTAITAGTATEFNGWAQLDLPNGLTDWETNPAYNGLTVTIAVQHNEQDGAGWVNLCTGGPYTAPTFQHLPYIGCDWNPTNPNAQARAMVIFSKSVQAGFHGAITTSP